VSILSFSDIAARGGVRGKKGKSEKEKKKKGGNISSDFTLALL